jgi:hypothetical protein
MAYILSSVKRPDTCFGDIIALLEQVKAKVKVTLRPTISRPVRLGVRRPSGTRNQFLYLLEIFLKTVTVCYVVAPSLTRGRVCNLL